MPEMPEVETVKNKLKEIVVGKKIQSVEVFHNNIIEYPTVIEFKQKLINQTIKDLKRRGKWIVFELDDYCLLSHLRMEGKYLIRTKEDKIEKHEHVVFQFEDCQLRYKDVRKFGKMHLILKDEINIRKPISELGFEPFDDLFSVAYLRDSYKKKSLPIKTALLDQTIVVGIGNIYANEILFLSKINPLKKACLLKDQELKAIIENTKKVLKKAIEMGGTTVHSYESSEGIHGNFQNFLYVHGKENEECSNCKTKIEKIKVGGRGTYFCPNCQK